VRCDPGRALARFDTRFLQLGLHPGGGHTWMLQRRSVPQAAAAMVLFGRVLDGPAAERAGLAWACVTTATSWTTPASWPPARPPRPATS
jgi:enoyl-CoA hydratase